MSELIKLQICTVTHRHGTNTYVCWGTEQDIKRLVGDSFCAYWWDELNGEAGPMPAERERIYDLYFEHYAEETAALDAVNLCDIKGGVVLGFTNRELQEVMTPEALRMFERGLTLVEHAELRASFRPILTLALEQRAACS